MSLNRNNTASPLGKLFDFDPPHSFQSESALLGSMILDAQVIPDVLAIVPRAEDFYDQNHATIFRAILDVYDRKSPEQLDLVLIQERLKQHGVYDQIGGDEKLLAIVKDVPSASNAPYYAAIVAEKAKLRQLIHIGGKMVFDAYHVGNLGPDGAKEIIDTAETAIFEAGQDQQGSEPVKLDSIVQAAMERLERADGSSFEGIPTGYRDLDAMLQGLQNGELTIIAARPSIGKTALALNLAEQIASGSGKPCPVGVLSLEMTRTAVGDRLISASSGVPANCLRSGAMEGERLSSVVRAFGTLRNLPIVVDDTPAMTVMVLRAKARRMVRKHRVRVLFIDYIQLLTAPGAARESRQVEVSAISRGIKALARELNIPIVCLSQLNRGSESRDGNRPRLSDLRESGSIEQDADVVMLIHREEAYHIGEEGWADANPDKVGFAEVIIAKQRNGPTGVVKMWWNEEATRFTSHDVHHGEEP